MQTETLFRSCSACQGQGTVPLHIPAALQEDDDPVPMQEDCVGECSGPCPVCGGRCIIPVAA